MLWTSARGARKVTLGLALSLLAALALTAGCSKKKTPQQPLKLEGVWVSNLDGTKLVIRQKGRFVILPAGQPEKKIRGAFRQGGGKAIFRNAPESQVCVGVEGIYTPQMEGSKLVLDAVKDECSSRRQLMTGGFKRASKE